MAGSIVASSKATSPGSKPRPYAMKTETNRCASAGLLRFGRRRHHAFRCDLSGDSRSTTHTVTGAVVGVVAARKVPAVRWNIAANIVMADSYTRKEP